MIVEFQPEHVRAMRLQGGDVAQEQVSDEDLAALKSAGPAVTMIVGRPVAAAGVIDLPDGSLLWAYLDESAGRHMVAIFRTAQRIVEVAKRPVYATVAEGFAQGHRLLRLLGFDVDRPLPEYGPDGRDHALWVLT